MTQTRKPNPKTAATPKTLAEHVTAQRAVVLAETFPNIPVGDREKTLADSSPIISGAVNTAIDERSNVSVETVTAFVESAIAGAIGTATFPASFALGIVFDERGATVGPAKIKSSGRRSGKPRGSSAVIHGETVKTWKRACVVGMAAKLPADGPNPKIGPSDCPGDYDTRLETDSAKRVYMDLHALNAVQFPIPDWNA